MRTPNYQRAHEAAMVLMPGCEQCESVGHSCRECYEQGMADAVSRWLRHRTRREQERAASMERHPSARR